MRERDKLGKQTNKKNDLRMKKSKENTLLYKHMYIYTHPRTFKHIYRYTYSHKHIICYSSQIVLFDIMFETV